ncbi:MAG: histidine phosphatase family protein, partial [Gallionella sp.]
VLVRHGESEGNVAGIINDDPTRVVSLTERGKSQAAATAHTLRTHPFTHACSSEFPRARQTADIILQYHSCALYIDARLNERMSGMDGAPVEEFNKLAGANILHFKPQHGESFLEQMERIRSFLNETAHVHPRATVLALSHENPILAAQALIFDAPEVYARGSIDNCQIVELEWPL